MKKNLHSSFDTLRSSIRNSHYRNECTLWELSVLRRTRQRVKTEGSVGMGSKEVEKRLEYILMCNCWLLDASVHVHLFRDIILFKRLLVGD